MAKSSRKQQTVTRQVMQTNMLMKEKQKVVITGMAIRMNTRMATGIKTITPRKNLLLISMKEKMNTDTAVTVMDTMTITTVTATPTAIIMTTPERFLLAGAMGWPVMHSRSPLIHNHWFAVHGLKGAYVPLLIEPGRVEAALRALPAAWCLW